MTDRKKLTQAGGKLPEALHLEFADWAARTGRRFFVMYGQTEAARSLGMTQGMTMKLIVLPQAIKNILPAIANEFVTIIKESSVCAYIGMYEIMYASQIVQGATFIIIQPLIVASVLYFCLTFPTSKVIGYFERRMSRGDKR